jgi:hypothetical protein
MLRFAVHRPGNPVASPRSHRMPCGDVPGRIHVCVAGEAAGSAPEARLALTRLRVHMHASAAALTCERGVDLLDPTGGLLVQTTDQQSPTGCKYLSVQSGLLSNVPPWLAPSPLCASGHVLEAEFLDPDHVETARQVGADLLTPVLPGISLAGTEPGGGKPGLGSSLAAWFRGGQPALQETQAPLALRAQTRTTQQLTGRKRGTHGHTTINTDHVTCSWAGNRARLRSEGHVPTTGAVLRNSVGLHAISHGTRPAKPHPAALRNEHLPRLSAKPANVGMFDCDDTETFVSTSLSPSRPAMSTGEEVLHGLIEVTEGLLLHRLASESQPSVFAASGRELPALRKVTRGTRPTKMPPRVLLTREIPNEPRMRAVLPQHCFLGGRRKHSITAHTKTLKTATDIPEEVKAAMHVCSPEGRVTPRIG